MEEKLYRILENQKIIMLVLLGFEECSNEKLKMLVDAISKTDKINNNE